MVILDHKKVQLNYCAICVLSGLSCYLFLKTYQIQRFFKFALNKWFSNENTYILSSSKDAIAVVEQMKRTLEDKKILGFDCEWVTLKKRRNPVALLQLAAPNGTCSLFRLCCMKSIPAELRELLEDKSILKVGVAVANDANFLLADYGVHCEGCLDLRYLARAVDVDPRGLAYLAKSLVNTDLNKDWRVRCSNWELETLTPSQVQYAAQDAQIAVQIFEKLNHRKICQNYSIWKRLFWSKSDYWEKSYSLWTDYIGLGFTIKSKVNGSSGALSGRQDKSIKTILKRNYSTLLQKPHYSNIFLLAPDEQVLCTISNSKAAWYIERGLVDVVTDDPKTLKLRFEPSKRTKEPDGYYTKPKENKCVVCGNQTNLRRKNVVPCEYKRNFQDALKNHHSHDVLLLCLACHSRSNVYDQVLRVQLAEECDAPLADGRCHKFQEVAELRAIKSAARALFYNGSVIPQERKTYLQTIICNKLCISSHNFTSDVLQGIININSFLENEHYSPHGQRVVQYYAAGDGSEALERKWRQHFINTMKPQHLPPLWSVNYIRD